MTDTAAGTSLDVFPTADLEPAVARHLAAQWREAQRLAMTSVIPKTITHRRVNKNGSWIDEPQPADVVRATVFAVVRYGDHFGFPPAIALNKIDVIEGRLDARYDALLGLMMDAGHQVRTREVSSTRAVIAVRRSEDRNDPGGWQVAEFTLEEAQAAGYVKSNPSERDLKGAWYTRRADMLMSKAAKRACRWFTPDVLINGGDDSLIEGTTVEHMVAPAAAAGIAEQRPAEDDEIVDGELVDEVASEEGADDREASDRPDGDQTSDWGQPSSDATDQEEEQLAKAQRGLMAQATKAFPKADGLLPAAQRARQTAQRHAVTYVALREHKSANDMTLDELRKVTTRLQDVIDGRLRIEDRDGQWVAVQGDRELPIPAEDVPA